MIAELIIDNRPTGRARLRERIITLKPFVGEFLSSKVEGAEVIHGGSVAGSYGYPSRTECAVKITTEFGALIVAGVVSANGTTANKVASEMLFGADCKGFRSNASKTSIENTRKSIQEFAIQKLLTAKQATHCGENNLIYTEGYAVCNTCAQRFFISKVKETNDEAEIEKMLSALTSADPQTFFRDGDKCFFILGDEKIYISVRREINNNQKQGPLLYRLADTYNDYVTLYVSTDHLLRNIKDIKRGHERRERKNHESRI